MSMYKIYMLIYLTFIYGCNLKGFHNHKPEFLALRFSYSLPLTRDTSIYNLSDSFFIFYQDDLIVYKTPIHKDYAFLNFDTSGNVISEKDIRNNVTYQYFIYSRDSVYGTLYDSLTVATAKKLSVDSFLKITSFKGFKFYDPNNDLLVYTSKSKNNLIEKYIPKIKHDSTYNDTTALYYSKDLINIPFSFSNELDKEKNNKLYRISLLYNKNLNLEKREILLMFEQTPVFLHPEIDNLLRSAK